MRTTSPDNAGTWVDVIFVGDFDENPDAPALDADRQAIADYLAAWDEGVETDAAHTYEPTRINFYSSDPGDEDGLIHYPWGSADDAYNVTVNGQNYVLALNRGLRYASLSRRPLGMA